MIRRNRDAPLYADGQHRWDPRSMSQDNQRNGAVAGYRPFEESPAIRPFRIPSSPPDFYPATRVLIVSNSTGQEMSPRFPAPPHGLIRRFNGLESMQVPTATETDGSKLTEQEQEIVLKKLKKEVYNPMPKILSRRVSLYYRDLNRDHTPKTTEKHREEDRKSCAVCLEDFEAREEVMLTPCNHMFHEECIVPWVKNHGQCPVCRTSFCERQQNASPFNNTTANANDNYYRQVVDPRVLFSDELLSLMQAVDEAFPWRM
ncbi:E3 ubiquitin-protein ligase RZF1 [Bienertia sinuspersici]